MLLRLKALLLDFCLVLDDMFQGELVAMLEFYASPDMSNDARHEFFTIL